MPARAFDPYMHAGARIASPFLPPDVEDEGQHYPVRGQQGEWYEGFGRGVPANPLSRERSGWEELGGTHWRTGFLLWKKVEGWSVKESQP
jgi:hypothetical protein